MPKTLDGHTANFLRQLQRACTGKMMPIILVAGASQLPEAHTGCVQWIHKNLLLEEQHVSTEALPNSCQATHVPWAGVWQNEF